MIIRPDLTSLFYFPTLGRVRNEPFAYGDYCCIHCKGLSLKRSERVTDALVLPTPLLGDTVACRSEGRMFPVRACRQQGGCQQPPVAHEVDVLRPRLQEEQFLFNIMWYMFKARPLPYYCTTTGIVPVPVQGRGGKVFPRSSLLWGKLLRTKCSKWQANKPTTTNNDGFHGFFVMLYRQ